MSKKKAAKAALSLSGASDGRNRTRRLARPAL